MINAILVFNNHGKPRLVRFYQHLVRHRGRAGPGPPLGCGGARARCGTGSGAGRRGRGARWAGGVPGAGRSCRCRVASFRVPRVTRGWRRQWPGSRGSRGCPATVSSWQAEEVQQQIIRDTFHLVLKRDDHICNFLECGRYRLCPPLRGAWRPQRPAAVPVSPQLVRRLRLQADLPPLRHAVLRVLRGLLGERAGHPGPHPGASRQGPASLRSPGTVQGRFMAVPALCQPF